MREVLSELNKTSGITGSMVVGPDGITIAADLSSRYDNETIGALASSISATVSKALEKMQQSSLQRLTIEAADGKLLVAAAPVGYLVVTTEENVNLGLIRLEMKNAARQLSI
ncbi:MAG: roadblock/LC7 domain-containing protein [candidate division Zixibacteria bacterium]|nr:roadblock/LC7 domain-containing protein [candidate division Zixibacteria bacterium]